MHWEKHSILLCLYLFLIISCKTAYQPPQDKSSQFLLVVDGIIVNGNDSSYIYLSRTRGFSDSAAAFLEAGAEVFLSEDGGAVYPFQEIGNGRYGISQLLLNSNSKYRLHISTKSGSTFESDTLPVKITPAIDSLTWVQDSSGVHIYVNTHDASNSTWYYRWTYTETWRYHTAYNSYFDYIDGNVVERPLSDHIYYCYTSHNSTDITVGSSVKLQNDVIAENILYTIPHASEKMSDQYSTLVNQYAVNQEAYSYWYNLKKNTEQLGTLFDAQPFSPDNSNIHCISDPQQIVLGYMSICSVQQKRIFISNTDLLLWDYYPYYAECAIRYTIPDSAFYYFPATNRFFFTFIGTDMGFLLYTPIHCADCRDHGGTTEKPFFWP